MSDCKHDYVEITSFADDFEGVKRWQCGRCASRVTAENGSPWSPDDVARIDIVTWLRASQADFSCRACDWQCDLFDDDVPNCQCRCHADRTDEAADEIERLRTEVKRLQDFAKVDAAEIELLGKKVDALQRRCAYLVRDTPYWQVYR